VVDEAGDVALGGSVDVGPVGEGHEVVVAVVGVPAIGGQPADPLVVVDHLADVLDDEGASAI